MIRNCPLCQSQNGQIVMEYVPREFDQYVLSNRSIVKVCDSCGTIFTDHGMAPGAIMDFYEKHSLYSGDLAGFGTGGATDADIERYSWYLELLRSCGVNSDMVIGDIGCGKGGFLKHLYENGFNKLCAIEVDPRCATIARKLSGFDIRLGSADNIPFNDNSVDSLVVAQVIEHLEDIHKSIQECYRVLIPGGYLLIEVPDAARYHETRLYDYCWISMMEHINHFTPHSLCQFMIRNGFEIVSVNQSDRTIKKPHLYPSLCIIGRKLSEFGKMEIAPDKDAKNVMCKHMQNEKEFAVKRSAWFKSIFASGKEIACWGISREFFNCIRFSGLNPSDLFAMYDKNPMKLEMTVGGKTIHHPDAIPMNQPDITVIITTVLHDKVIQDELIDRGFKGRILLLEQ